ncbi:hypothetical protein ACTWP5_19790 [Streptomyces sp. 4N509B]|uniref:hypothetical protein n=1 Tax=Streptomyces sp. 4N509B TaxID=3457413 RepID=UPI003FD2C218
MTTLRVARAAVFAALCVTLSTGAHVLLSGAPLPLPTVGLVAVAVFLLALALAGRGPRRFAHIAGLLLPVQLAADTILTTGQSTCYGPSGGPVTGTLRFLGVDLTELVCSGGELGSPLPELASGETPLAHPAAPWLLLALHLLVGLLAAAWLAWGEQALARLLRSAAAAFRPLLVAFAALRSRVLPVAGPGARVRRPAARGAAPALPLLTHSVVRRGPPPRLTLAA